MIAKQFRKSSIDNHQSLLQKRAYLGVYLLVCKRVDAQGMLVAGSRTHAASLAGNIDDMNFSSFFSVFNLKCAVRAKCHTKTAAPARIYICKHGNNGLYNDCAFCQGYGCS